MSEITDTFHAPSRREWREWLAENHATRSEIWLVSYLKRTGRASVPYHHAVEEALCFGWIDGIRRKLDEDRYAQRFTPRRSGSPISQLNRERLARLLEADRVHPAVRDALGDVRPEHFQVPEDIEDALRAVPAAWEHWQRFSAPYRRIRAAWVDAARPREEVFAQRLATLVRKTSEGRRFGYGIEDFY